ncbi:MAG TPA: UPF0182 family protein [Candidatus Binataceae bacterium]|jgi:uncharacterized membrane protein (UPF0182 family)|nr:UPF0182 family protein [Candidatus Binataceae bacterium]
MRSRLLLFGLAAAIIVVLIVLGVADSFLIDLLWFSALGYKSVFWTSFLARIVVFAVVLVIAAAAFYLSGVHALRASPDRERLRVVRFPEDMRQLSLPDVIRSLGERVPWRLLIAAAALLLGIFAAVGESSNWDTYLKALYGTSFGIGDLAFGKDAGFYVFTLPLLTELRDLALLVIFLAAAVGAGVYWARGALDFREAPPRISGAAVGQFSVLLGLFFLQRAYGYWLARFDLLFHTDGVVFGFRYVDDVLWRPGLWLLVGLSIAAAIICFSNLGPRGAWRMVLAAVIVFVPALILNLLQPVVESLRVKPDELRIERPYLANNIKLTRHAYKLDGIDVMPFKTGGELTQASLLQDAPTVKNIRLWDPRPLLATYRQLQEIRLYYDFRDVEVDRYWIQNNYTEVMLSARELNPDLLAENAHTWVNQHLKFTHGSGIVMSPVHDKDAEGLPVFYLSDIPSISNVGLRIDQPGIYFGEEPDNYAMVKTNTPEFDYPRGSDNVYGYYHGDDGVQISGLIHRLLFSYYYRDLNLLVSDTIQRQSKILIRRNIRDRISQLAPFLAMDHDPYIVLHSGKLAWIVDCYTTSDRFPYSQRNADQINYIRNSVKVVVDAYTGRTVFYVADPEDPIIQTWQRIFPALFQPLSAMPADLRQHIRYPEDMFLIQADIYSTYHMTDPQVFYNREDLWGFPRENYGGETGPMQPYYVIMRLPNEPHEEYILMLPMVPRGRDNMISWLAAGCDGDHYGHLIEYAFSKDKLIYGPYQIQARINQNPEISRQMSLWNQMGSRVILGNLLVIPIENSLLYVEPLYLRAENGQLPELQRVIASYSDRVVMGDNLDLTLAALFKPGALPAPQIVTAQVPALAKPAPGHVGPAGGPPASGDVRAAADHYERALKALRVGDWSGFGAEMQKLGETLQSPMGH